jgi:hypothetical protein
MKTKPVEPKKRRIIVNNDYYNIFQVKPPGTDQDIYDAVDRSPEVVGRPCGNLPVTVPAGGEVTLRMVLGDDIARAAKEDMIESICPQAVSSDCDDYNNYTLKLNTVDLARQYAFSPYAVKPETRFIFPEPDTTMPPVPLEKVRRHRVRAIDLHLGVNYITIKSHSQPLTVVEVELAIQYRKSVA